MELDHDLREGTSTSILGQTSGHALASSSSLMQLEARAADWSGAVRSLINTAFEDGDLEEAYSIVVQNTGDVNRPNADTILQLVALALDPDACLPTRKKRKDRKNKQQLEDEDSEDEDDDDDDDDTFLNDAYALKSHHASQKAINLLQRWIRQPGPSKILASIPRRADPPHTPARTRYTFAYDDENQLKPLQIVARRVTLCDDVWQLLSKQLMEENSKSSRSSILDRSQSHGLSESAWDLLKVLVEAWRTESETVTDDSKQALRYSPSLLAPFKPSAIGGPPTDISASMDIVFQPFKEIHLGDLKRAEHMETALQLLDLLAALACQGAVDKSAFESDFCEALYQLKVSNLQELVSSCLPDQHAIKIDLLNSYLTKYSAPPSTVFPKPPQPEIIASPAKPSPAKPSSSAPTSSRTSLPSSQRNVIEIDSDSDSSDSDIVCLNPIIPKSTPSKPKQPPARPKGTPVKAKPLAQASPSKPNGLNSSQSSQDVKPNITAILDPLLAKPNDIIENMTKQIPRELLSLSEDAPKLRVPSRAAQSSKAIGANGKSITQGMLNAEIKFASIKLEIARVHVAYADTKKATVVHSDWKACKVEPLLSKGLRGHRYLFVSDEGDLPSDLEAWERREQAVVDSLF